MSILKFTLTGLVSLVISQSAFAAGGSFQWDKKVDGKAANGFVLHNPVAIGSDGERLPLGLAQGGMDVVCAEAAKIVASEIKVSDRADYKGIAIAKASKPQVAMMNNSTFSKVAKSEAVTALHCISK